MVGILLGCTLELLLASSHISLLVFLYKCIHFCQCNLNFIAFVYLLGNICRGPSYVLVCPFPYVETYPLNPYWKIYLHYLHQKLRYLIIILFQSSLWQGTLSRNKTSIYLHQQLNGFSIFHPLMVDDYKQTMHM